MQRFGMRTMLVASMTLGDSMALGQTYPHKPPRIITSEPGGASDLVSRLIGQGLAAGLGQSVVIENRPGLIAIENVANATPDGYSLLVSSNLVWTLPLMQKVRYDALKNFIPVGLVASTPNVIVVHPALPVNSVKELIALAKAKPGDLNYSAGSLGSTPHLAGELFKAMAGVQLVMVPYRGAGPALTALAGGEVRVMFPGAGSARPHINSGRIKALAVTGLRPFPLLPRVPTVAATVPGFEIIAMYGLFAPARTPAGIIHRLNQDMGRYINTVEAKEKFLNAGLEAVGNSPEQFAVMMKADMVNMTKVIKDAGITQP